MSKKYQIVNSNSNSNIECTFFYLLYIVLFFVIILIIYKIIYSFNKTESFENLITSNEINSQQIFQELKDKNKELANIKNTLQNKLLEQSQAIYISNNFDKVDESSFNSELNFILIDFANTKLPEIDISNKKIIETQSEFDGILAEAENMKNFYKPGDIVNKNSTFGITKNDVCYRYDNKLIKPTTEFIKQYPNCMVCEVENNDNVENSSGWKHTKTNISKVCLYDPNAKSDSGIPNLTQCKNFCNILT